MITRQLSLEQMPEYPFEREYPLEKLVFFDIETTGFAANSTYLYLIGCTVYKDSSFFLIQWFAEDIKEEPLLLSSFFEFLKDYEILIHYNGSGFDLPYLLKKCAQWKLDYSFDHLISIDIYKKLLPLKKLLQLPSLRLKSIETFLGIQRKDLFDGGELIQVYQSYLGKRHYELLRSRRVPDEHSAEPSQAEELLGLLLLHNEDDLRGLLLVSSVLSYTDLLEKPIRILQAQVEGTHFLIRFQLSSSLPARISGGNDLARLTAEGRDAALEIQIYDGELKYFYENYRDYYYLTSEDSVIHKSLAQYVDKEFRIKAKPSNCYTRKKGLFTPQYEPLFAPSFRLDYQSKLSFLEIHTDFLLQEEKLEEYVKHILRYTTGT